MAKRSGGTRARMPASYKYAPNFASHNSTIEVHKRIASNAVARLRRIIFVLQPNQKVKINREKTIVTNHLSSSRAKDKDAFDKYHGYTKIG